MRLLLHVVALLALPAWTLVHAATDAELCGSAGVGAADRVAACDRVLRSAQLAPADAARTVYSRGVAYGELGDNERAIADFTTALRGNPRDPMAFYGRAVARFNKGDQDLAIADYDSAIRLKPDFAPGYHGRGFALSARADYDGALRDYREAVRLDPNFAPAFHGQGLAWTAKRDYERAIASFDQALRLDPQLADAYYGRGIARFFKGGFADSASDFGEAGRWYSAHPAPKARAAEANIWRFLATARAGDRTRAALELTGELGHLDRGTWPGPIILALLGQADPRLLPRAAASRDREIERRQLCEMNFFIGEFYLLDGPAERAGQKLRTAAKDCPTEDDERLDALAELARLGM